MGEFVDVAGEEGVGEAGGAGAEAEAVESAAEEEEVEEEEGGETEEEEEEGGEEEHDDGFEEEGEEVRWVWFGVWRGIEIPSGGTMLMRRRHDD